MRSETLLRRYPLTSYFVLVYALAWGGILWVVEGLADSGSSPAPAEVGMMALPMLFAPGLAALVLTALVEGKTGLRAIWARMTRWRVELRWYALAVVALPLLVLAILYWLGALVSPVYAPTLALMGLAGLFAGYLVEIGWTGYATPRLLARCSSVRAGLWLGALWGIWHAPADYAIRGSTLGAFWPVTFDLFILPLIAWRIVMTVVCARTQSGVIAQWMHFAYTGKSGSVYPVCSNLSNAGCAGVRHPRGRVVAGRGRSRRRLGKAFATGAERAAAARRRPIDPTGTWSTPAPELPSPRSSASAAEKHSLWQDERACGRRRIAVGRKRRLLAACACCPTGARVQGLLNAGLPTLASHDSNSHNGSPVPVRRRGQRTIGGSLASTSIERLLSGFRPRDRTTAYVRSTS